MSFETVRQSSHFAELKDLPEAGEEELSMMTKIADNDHGVYTTAAMKGLRP